MQLTNDADKMVCHLYKLYLEKRKQNIDKLDAIHFSFAAISGLPAFSKWSESDIEATIAELKRADLGKMFLDRSFVANDNFIFYMENRFKNGLSEVLDFISKFIP